MPGCSAPFYPQDGEALSTALSSDRRWGQPLPNLMGTPTSVIGEHEVAEELLVMYG